MSENNEHLGAGIYVSFEMGMCGCGSPALAAIASSPWSLRLWSRRKSSWSSLPGSRLWPWARLQMLFSFSSELKCQARTSPFRCHALGGGWHEGEQKTNGVPQRFVR